jgi:hypothetical protein
MLTRALGPVVAFRAASAPLRSPVQLRTAVRTLIQHYLRRALTLRRVSFGAGRFTANKLFVFHNGDCNVKTARKETLVFPTKAVPSTSAPPSE